MRSTADFTLLGLGHAPYEERSNHEGEGKGHGR